MRILILTILFASGFYYFRDTQEVTSAPIKPRAQLDSIKVKSAAPDRAERILTARPVEKPAVVETESSDAGREISSSEEEEDYTYEEDHVEEVPATDLDQAWNHELKDVLNRLEPAEGDNMHKAYMAELESYKAEMDALMSEKQSQTSELGLESEQMISQLDQKHEDNLKEIFGAHYDAVRDHYQEYMQGSRQ